MNTQQELQKIRYVTLLGLIPPMIVFAISSYGILYGNTKLIDIALGLFAVALIWWMVSQWRNMENDIQEIDAMQKRLEEIEQSVNTPKETIPVEPSVADRITKRDEKIKKLMETTRKDFKKAVGDKYDLDADNIRTTWNGSEIDIYVLPE